MSKDFFQLPVKSVSQETSDAVSVTFDIPQDLKATFAYKQGQYLTLKFNLNGAEVRRAYSMCSSPVDPDITVTVKRVKGGLVSNHINDAVKAGTSIEVMPPEGRFFTELDADKRKTYYLIGAGSGITPLYSIIKTILEEEPQSSVHLLYGNRNETTIIFKDSIDELARKYSGQFTVNHILSQPLREKKKGIGGLFSKGKISWTGAIGRIDTAVVGKFLEEHPNKAKAAEYFICGPGDMINTAEAALKGMDIDPKTIHAERFTNDNQKAKVASGGGAAAVAQVNLNDKLVTISVPANKTILDVLIDEKHDPPYSCTSGACSTCMAKVTKGSVKMDACYALDDDEVEEGYILTCQAHPTSDEVHLTFDI